MPCSNSDERSSSSLGAAFALLEPPLAEHGIPMVFTGQRAFRH